LNKIPVIILNWNGLADTIKCTESVLEQSYPEYMVFLIDNGSPNNEFDALAQRFGGVSNVELIKNTHNIGFGNAHNLLFQQLINAGFSHVALINNDAIAQANWLNEAVNALIAEDSDIVACKMLQHNNRSLIDSAGLKMLNTGEIIPRGQGKQSISFSKREQVLGFCGGACLIKLSLINEIGGFDTYFDTGYEDAELSLRALVNGKKIIFEPNSVVDHKMGQSLAKVKSYARTLKIMRDINYTALTNLPLSVLIINFPFYVLKCLMMLLVFIISFRFRYLIFFFHSLVLTIFVDFKLILKNRRLKKRKIGCIKMLFSQQFFLIHDYQRFSNYILKRQAHKFEQ
jgi:GT2 family glycosyltransferase